MNSFNQAIDGVVDKLVDKLVDKRYSDIKFSSIENTLTNNDISVDGVHPSLDGGMKKLVSQCRLFLKSSCHKVATHEPTVRDPFLYQRPYPSPKF